ncbi:MAG: AsmA-like C-terminal region-containing protein [Chthoniobacteraceae bacterium]
MTTLVSVQNFSKRFLISAGILAGVAILLGLDLYAGSKGVRARLEAALKRELGVPVQFGSLHYTLWGGLTGNDVECDFGAMGTEGGTGSTLTIPSVSASISWIPLLSGHVVIKKLLFKAPVLTWTQGKNGMWNSVPPKQPCPLAPHEAAPEAKGGPSAAESPTPEGTHKPHKKKREHGPKRALEFGIQAIKVENATLRFIDHQGRPTVTFEGANIYLRDPEKPEGTVAVAKTTLREGLVIDGFAAPFSYRKGGIALAPIDARIAQGTIRGSATLQPTQDLPLFTIDLLFDGVSIDGMLTQFGQEQTAQRATGTMQGSLDLYGAVGQKRSIQGIGQLKIRESRVEQVGLLEAIGKILQIEELREMQLHNAQLDLRAAEGKVFVDSLVVESVNMSLAANGTSEWDGKLNLAARLAVGPKISRQLPGWMDAGFQPVPGGNFREIAFNIKGTVSHPSTDLLPVLMGQKYGTQFLNLWQSLTGKGKKKPVDKKKPEPTEENGDSTQGH